MERKIQGRYILISLIIGLIFCSHAWTAAAAGIRPLAIDLDLKPGDYGEFELHIIPGLGEELVDLTLYQPVQLLSGSLIYEQPMNPSFTALSWISLEQQTVRVLPGEEAVVKGTVRIPFSASGSHTVVIMVEPRIPKITSGIGFQVRYAVRLNIRIDKPGLRHQAQLGSLGLEADDEGLPVIKGLIQNPSAWDFLVSGEAVIRDENRRLVERITLRAPAAMTSGSDATRVYPGAEVEFLGKVTRRITPGEYTIQAFFRYGENGQILFRDNITVHPDDFNFPGIDELGAVTAVPEAVYFPLRAGERRSQVFELQNEMGDPVQVEVELADIVSEYPYSLIDWIQLRAQSGFEIPARGKSRFAMTIAVPREEVADGSYHGNLVLKALHKDTSELLSERKIPLSVLVGDQHQMEVEIRSLTGQYSPDEGSYLSLDLYNSGNVPISPTASLVISTEQGEFVQRSLMTLPEGVIEVLPLQLQQLESVVQELEAGTYEVEIQITHRNEEIPSEKHSLVVTP